MTDLSSFRYIANAQSRKRETDDSADNFITQDVIQKVRNFHQSFHEYRITPLHRLQQLSRRLNVQQIWVKDESYRFGLNAFKALGGTYAIAQYLATKLRLDLTEISFATLKSNEMKEHLGHLTFVTATDGNHGKGIAWAAKELDQKAVVFLPKGSSRIRVQNIMNEGAEAIVTDLNYDDTVRFAKDYADRNNGVFIQDTSWNGYEEIPTWITQGYCTLMDEAMEQIEAANEEHPTHVFLQAGVGSFAASGVGYLVAKYGTFRPITVIVEPDKAACIYQSMVINDGKPHAVTGNMPTMMAGLACGEPSALAWGILRSYADASIACPDHVSAKGMRILGNPLPGDPQVISGESGAVGLGVLSLIQETPELQGVAEQLHIDANSRVLLINTEGDTDPESYRNIVWNGNHPSL